MQILLRRIAISESEDDERYRSDKEIISQWFPETIHDIEPSNYVLNNSWHKPRDIVRFIISAQNSINSDSKSCSQAVFSSLHKQYSIDSLSEIREEMRALYTSEQIEEIIDIFTGFKSIFSVHQLRTRVSKFFGNSIIDTNFNAVLNDLYRLGFIGDFFPASQMYRWQHKGDDRLIISDEWRIMIHQALQSALSVGKKHDYSMKRFEKPQIGDVVYFEVKSISRSFVNGFIDYYGKSYPAYIHISKIADVYIRDINDYMTEGEELRTAVIEYDEKRNKLSLRKIQE